jgi:type II secretory pathway component PulJ
MEPTQSSETSDFNTQTPGKYPEDNLSLLQHGESLKTRKPPIPFRLSWSCWFCKYNVYNGTPHGHPPPSPPYLCTDQWISHPVLHYTGLHHTPKFARPTYTLQATVTKFKHKMLMSQIIRDWTNKWQTHRTADLSDNVQNGERKFYILWVQQQMVVTSGTVPQYSRMMADNTKQICPWPTTLGIIVPYSH